MGEPGASISLLTTLSAGAAGPATDPRGMNPVHQARHEMLCAKWRAPLYAAARNELLRLGSTLGYTEGLSISPAHTDAIRTSLLNNPAGETRAFLAS